MLLKTVSLIPAALFSTLCSLSLAAELEVQVLSNGSRLNQNGQSEVPVGLFGAHALRGDLSGMDEELGIHAYRTINYSPSGNTQILHREKRKKKKKNRKNKKQAEVVATPSPTPTPAPMKLHAFNGKMDVFIDCEGDRFMPPLQLIRTQDWEQQVEGIARRYGEKWKRIKAETDYPGDGIVQWWNEPYLNWAERTAGDAFDGGASIYDYRRYDMERAVPGGPVHIKGVEKPLTHMVWKNIWPTRKAIGRNFRNGDTREHLQIGWNIDIPEGLKVGDTFEAAETRYWREPGVMKTWTVTEIMRPWDPTVTGYWSGRQALEFYSQMFAVWSRTLRESNPDITILGGWDFNYSAGDWTVWSELYRPLLQQFPQHIDGLTEHHYGIEPALIQAWYELGTGEAMAFTGRWLKNWNTETQGRLDPAVYGKVSNAVGKVPDRAEAAFWEAQYNLADIIGLIANTPAKAGSRTIHNFSGKAFPRSGGGWALRFLKPLRGDLIAMQSDDQRLWAAASIPSEHDSVGTTLALYNSAPEDMSVSLPHWQAGNATLHRLQANNLSQLAEVTGETPLLSTISEPVNGNIKIPSRTAVLITWPEALQISAETTRKQFFPAEGGLLEAGGDQGELILNLIGNIPTQEPKRAWLRLVSDRIPAGTTLNLAGTEIELKRIAPVTDIPIPPSLIPQLAKQKTLRFNGSNSYRIVMASVMIEE